MSNKNPAINLTPDHQPPELETGTTLEIGDPSDQIPQPSDTALPVRAQTASLIEISMGWYQDKDVTVVEWEEVAMEYRKRLFNLLKNHYIQPAFMLVEQDHSDRQNLCKTLACDLLHYLQFIHSHPEWDKYLPIQMSNKIYKIAYEGDWHSEKGLIEIRKGIHQALKIPLRKKTV